MAMRTPRQSIKLRQVNDCEEEGCFVPAMPVLFEIFVQGRDEKAQISSLESTIQGTKDALAQHLSQIPGIPQNCRVHRLIPAFPKNKIVRCESIGVVSARELKPYAFCVDRRLSAHEAATFVQLNEAVKVQEIIRTNPPQTFEFPRQTWIFGRSQPPERILQPQCGILVEVVYGKDLNQCRAEELDPESRPGFEAHIEEMILEADDEQLDQPEQDLPYTDERLWESALFQQIVQDRENRRTNLIFFGYDGHTTERRDATCESLSVESVLDKVQHAWRERQNHLIVPYVLAPQPDEFQGQGVAFVVILQNTNAGHVVVGRGEVATLTAVQMHLQSASSTEGPLVVYRGSALDQRTNAEDVIKAHELQEICHPTGRRPCAIQHGSTSVQADSVPLIDGSFLRVLVGPESTLPMIRQAFRDFDVLRAELFGHLPRDGILSVKLVTFGHRFFALGKREHVFEMTNAWYPAMLADQILQSWPGFPPERLKIFRARQLDVHQAESSRVTIHLLLGFDHRPGNALILALGQNMDEATVTMDGPELLSPHLWNMQVGGMQIQNPLSSQNYAVNFDHFASSNRLLFCKSGDVVVYVAQSQSSEEDEQHSLFQLPQQNFVEASQDRASRPFVHTEVESQISVLHGQFQFESRRKLELFPLLEAELPSFVKTAGSREDCKAFFRACKQLQLCEELPNERVDVCHPISVAYLKTCEPIVGHECSYHVYTDGAAYLQKVEDYSVKEASWAGVVFRVAGSRREFVGWMGGSVPTDSAERTFLGCDRKAAIDAERTAIFWMLAWSLSLPQKTSVTFYVDNQAAGFGASGKWQVDENNPLAVKIRQLTQIVKEHIEITFEHVKAHTLQPQNELVDKAAGLVGELQCPPNFKCPEAVRKIAQFDHYKTLWFLINQERSLPPFGEDKIRVQMNCPPCKLLPHLLRSEPGRAQELQTCKGEFDISLASYNVLTLRAGDQTKSIDADSLFLGKVQFLKEQMRERKIHIMALQECRGLEDALIECQNFCRLVAAGTREGTHGVEVWMNKTLPIGQVDGSPIFLDSSKITVRHASLNLLIVHFAVRSHDFVLLNCHAPQSGQSLEVRTTWWLQLQKELAKIKPHEKVILAGDLNARLDHECHAQVGPLLCEKGNPNSQFLYDLLGSFPDYCVPSTFPGVHTGPSATWRHSSGSMSRLDYFPLQPKQWASFQTTAWPLVDAGNAGIDHFPLGLRVRSEILTTKTPDKNVKIDWALVRAPQSQDKLCKIVEGIPVASWEVHPTDQVQWLTHDLHEALKKHFPLRGLRFNQPYMTEEVWKIRQKRKQLTSYLRFFHRDLANIAVRFFLQDWQD